jgi:broad specificity phosphatase PhoE
VLVQHGEKDRGDDPGLTSTGIRQAWACAQRLSDVAAVYSSPMRRGVETARVISEAHDLPAFVDGRLTERMNWIPSSGLSLDEFLAEWERASLDRDHVPPVGDSSHATGARMSAAIMSLADRHRTGTVVCVTHGGATVDLLRDLVGDEALDAASPGIIRSGIPGGALTTISVGPTGLRVVRIAAIDHLPEADRTGHAVDSS